ncbi:MAG: hypothetical protein U0228_28005 [Myxococcaceae bacterium]
MDSTTFEFGFDLFYLVAIFALGGTMLARCSSLPARDQPMARRLAWAFTLLGTGDLGHIGLRVLAHLDPPRFSAWVGWGGFPTAITVTIFYALMFDAWRVRTGRAMGALGATVIGVSALRLVLLVLPGNDWGAAVPPFGWSLVRNVPLVVVGVVVTVLFLRERALRVMGALMAVSFACYLPVILLVQHFPMVGLLMIPKTVAYLAMGGAAYLAFFRSPHDPHQLLDERGLEGRS